MVPEDCISRRARRTCAARSSAEDSRTPRMLARMPPPASAISSYAAPAMRFSKSMRRGLAKTGWVCESTKPGKTTLLRQPISSAFFASGRSSSVVPTAAILPFLIRTAPSSMMPRSRICNPRRGAASPRKVRSCEAWVRMVALLFICRPFRDSHLPFRFPSAEALGFDIAPLRGCRLCSATQLRNIWFRGLRLIVYPPSRSLFSITSAWFPIQLIGNR